MKRVICVLRAIDVAEYFLSKDPERKLFTKKLQTKNGRKFYEGNARRASSGKWAEWTESDCPHRIQRILIPGDIP